MGLKNSIKKINVDMTEPVFVTLEGFELAVFTTKGSKGGKNEDSCGFSSPTPTQLALVVSDGLGGHQMGDKASKLVINTLLSRGAGRRPFKSSHMITKIEKAHQKILDLNVDAGATVVSAIVEGRKLWFYCVGDSVGFLIKKDGTLSYKTFEHSVTGFAAEAGLMSEAEAQNHSESHVILNSLGFNDSRIESSLELNCDIGDVLVLCTDGITEILTVDEIVESLHFEKLEDGVNQLFETCSVKRAKKSHFDDLTFIICKIKK